MELRAVLKHPRLLQQVFLGMERDCATTLGLGLDTLRAQRASGAGLNWKGERLPGVLLPLLVQPKPGRDQGVYGITCRASASHGFQIDPKLALMDLALAPMIGHFSHQLAFGVGKFLAGGTIPKGRVAHRLCHLQPDILLAFFVQGQGGRSIGGIAR